MDATIRLPTKRELIQEDHPAPEIACRLHDHAHDLLKDRKPHMAKVALTRALAIAPDHPVMLSAMGSTLFELGRYAEAEQILRKSIAIEGEYAPSRAGLGSSLAAQNRFEEAKVQFEIALKIEPDYTDAVWNYSMVLLDHGEWKTAKPYYAERKKRGGPSMFPPMPYQLWAGEDLNGKTILVHGEQGVGDRILFSRYLVWLRETYPDARILCFISAVDQPDTSNLMWAYRDVVEFLPNGITWPTGVDYGCFLMDLPFMHGSTPDNVFPDRGHLRRHAELCGKSVTIPTANGNEFRVGINWTGSPGMIRNNERSIPPELMFTLAESPDIMACSLQYRSGDIARLGADQLICDLTPDIGQLGFLGTAGVMQKLDLVITNCTSVAHLAGATGVPCWTLLCANPYWVWGRSGETTPWYPNMRLFRQKKMGEWESVVAQVKSELFALAAEHVAKTENSKAA